MAISNRQNGADDHGGDEDGGGWITDLATCEQARTALGLSDTSVSSDSYSWLPRGCVSNSAGSEVYFNTQTGYSRDCGYNSYSCLGPLFYEAVAG